MQGVWQGQSYTSANHPNTLWQFLFFFVSYMFPYVQCCNKKEKWRGGAGRGVGRALAWVLPVFALQPLQWMNWASVLMLMLGLSISSFSFSVFYIGGLYTHNVTNKFSLSMCTNIACTLLITAQSHHRMALCPCYRLLLKNFAILCIGYNYSAREQDVELVIKRV